MKNIDYKSILVITIGFLALYYIFDWKVFEYIGFGVGVLSLLSKHAASAILWVWHKIAHVLGWINTRIILSVVYIVFLVPLAFLSRLVSKSNIRKIKGNSAFHDRNHAYTAKDMENSW
mgnify:CR=1 FL=1